MTRTTDISTVTRQFYNVQDENRWGREAIPDYQPLVESLLQRIVADSRGIVVELGCGRGAFGYLARRYAYLGIDIPFGALQQYMVANCGVQADIAFLPVASLTVDFVFSFATLEHVPDPEIVLKEIHRVLKPGGAALIAPAWFCRPWASKGLPVRSYADLSLGDKMRKGVIPIRNHLLWRALFVTGRRFSREIHYHVNSENWKFRYKKLKPNLTEYIYTDCDAFSSLDPHEVALLFKSWGYQIPLASTLAKRLMLRHAPLLLRKPLQDASNPVRKAA